MKLEKWALIAEIIGSVAIVGSLLFLMVEVRDNTAAIRAGSRESIAGRIEQRAMEAAVSRDLLDALTKAREGGQLDSVELAHVRFFYTSVLTSAEEAFLQYRDERLVRYTSAIDPKLPFV